MSPIDSLPALLGGSAVRPQGPPEWPLPDESILEALRAAYGDGSWGKYQGGHVERLETRLAEYHQIAHVSACGSGTFAVEVALRALKVGSGDEVILAAYDYGGNFLAVHAVGAFPVLVDVAAHNWNLDPARLTAAFGPRTRALVVSHLHGGVVPMRAVMEIAKAHGVPVIEDAAQMPGAVIQGRKAGTWGDVGILSFGGSKLLTAGRGGALLTPHADIQQRARLHLYRGNHICPLSELQAAVLLPQLEQLDARNRHRAGQVLQLARSLQGLPGFRLFVNADEEDRPGYYKLGFQFDASAFGLSRAVCVKTLRAEGIAFDEGFRALHVGRSPARFRAAEGLDEATRAHQQTIILHHPVLLGSAADIEQVAAAIHKTYANARLLETKA